MGDCGLKRGGVGGTAHVWYVCEVHVNVFCPSGLCRMGRWLVVNG